MSLFSAAFQRVIQSREWTQSQTADACGISQGSVSQYLAGRRPAPDQLKQICAALEDHERGQLLAAHLRDEVPADFRALVSIIETGESPALREEALDAWQTADLPDTTRAALELIAREARSDETVREWLHASAALLR